MKTRSLAAAIGLILAVGAASAADIYVQTTSTGPAGTGETSADFNVISTNVDATSVYTATKVVTDADGLIGETAVPFTDTSSGGEINSFLVGTSPLGVNQNGGLLDEYRLLFDYTVTGTAAFVDGLTLGTLPPDGTLDAYNQAFPFPAGSDGIIDPWDAIVPTFASGTFEITYLADLNHGTITAGDTVKLLEMSLDSAEVVGADVVFFTLVDYTWYDPTDAGLSAEEHSLIQNYWNFADPINIAGTDYNSFYDIWAAGLAAAVPIEIIMRSDFNIDPAFVPVCDDAACTTLSRETNLNVTSIVFTQAVPVPGTVALLGLGLIGLAGFRRRFFA